MARIARIVAYVYDPNADYYSLEEEVARVIDSKTDLMYVKVDSEEKIFEWDDDLDINYEDCTKEQFAKFFRELPKEATVEE